MVRDLVCGLIVLGLAAFYIGEAYEIPDSALGDAVGSAGFPFILGWMLAAAGGLLVVQALAARRSGVTPAGDVDQPARVDQRHAFLRALGLVTIAAIFLLLLNVLGYLVSLVLLIAAVAAYQGISPSWRLGAVAGLGGLALWVLFVIVLDIPLPAGFWPNLIG